MTIAAPGAVDASSAIPSAWPWQTAIGTANRALSPGVGSPNTGHPAVTVSLVVDYCCDSFRRVQPSGFVGSTPSFHCDDQGPHYCYCCCRLKTDSRLPRKGSTGNRIRVFRNGSSQCGIWIAVGGRHGGIGEGVG